MDELGLVNYYHVPCICKKCGGVLVYKGVGEYQCEDCKNLDYDDYGKVRRYIENHRGATAVQIEAAVGVSQRTIRQMLRESRLEIAEGSRIFLHCEVCGKNIRSGRFCPECELNIHRNIEAQQRAKHKDGVRGYGKANSDEGQKRFVRE